MGRTIIQPIGPLYGEAVNGTVFGRPNGSIYIPPSNTIKGTIVPNTIGNIRIMTYGYGKRIQLCTNTGTISGANYYLSAVAQSQDIASYMKVHIEDENGDIVGSARTTSAGIFNSSFVLLGDASDDTVINNGDTYTIVLELVAASGVAVATDTVEVTGWSE